MKTRVRLWGTPKCRLSSTRHATPYPSSASVRTTTAKSRPSWEERRAATFSRMTTGGRRLSNKLRKLIEEPRLLTAESTARTHSSKSDVLAGEAARPNRCFGMSFGCTSLMSVAVDTRASGCSSMSWQKGLISHCQTVSMPARSKPRSKPPMPAKKLATRYGRPIDLTRSFGLLRPGLEPSHDTNVCSIRSLMLADTRDTSQAVPYGL